jgi:hypothetical protein
MEAGPRTRAELTLRDVSPPPKREVAGTVKLDPPDAAEDAEWLNITGWQGGGSVVDFLRKEREGEYRTTKPIPVYDNWKVTMRLHKDRTVASVPIFMPQDEAIPVPEIPAEPRITRNFVLDKENLLREQKDDAPPFLTTAAYVIVLLIGLGLFASLGWGLARFGRLTGVEERRPAAASGR